MYTIYKCYNAHYNVYVEVNNEVWHLFILDRSGQQARNIRGVANIDVVVRNGCGRRLRTE